MYTSWAHSMEDPTLFLKTVTEFTLPRRNGVSSSVSGRSNESLQKWGLNSQMIPHVPAATLCKKSTISCPPTNVCSLFYVYTFSLSIALKLFKLSITTFHKKKPHHH